MTHLTLAASLRAQADTEGLARITALLRRHSGKDPR